MNDFEQDNPQFEPDQFTMVTVCVEEHGPDATLDVDDPDQALDGDALPECKSGTEIRLPIVFAWDPKGNPVPMQIDRPPESCDHAGASFSTCLDVRCPRCGARMMLPPYMLAHLPAQTINTMDQMWADAGWPEWLFGEWTVNWPIHQHPLFEIVNGIPVRDSYEAAWIQKWEGRPAAEQILFDAVGPVFVTVGHGCSTAAIRATIQHLRNTCVAYLADQIGGHLAGDLMDDGIEWEGEPKTELEPGRRYGCISPAATVAGQARTLRSACVFAADDAYYQDWVCRECRKVVGLADAYLAGTLVPFDMDADMAALAAMVADPALFIAANRARGEQ